MKNVAFPVYYNWYDWLRQNLPPEERCEVTDALRDYYETGAAPEEAVRESLRLVVSLMHNEIDAAREKSRQASEYGKMGAKKKNGKNDGEDGDSETPEGTLQTPEGTPDEPEDAPGLKENKRKEKGRKEKENDSFSLSYDRARGEDVTPPDFWEVWDYIKKECIDVDPRKFFDYYESVGWRERGQPIVNWKAKAELWELRERDFAG